MKSCVWLVAVALFACESKSEKARPAPPSGAMHQSAAQRDLERICNVEELSGANDLAPGARAMHTGVWLANNLESQEARKLSAELVSLQPEPRIERLKEELARHGIDKCEILYAWGGSMP